MSHVLMYVCMPELHLACAGAFSQACEGTQTGGFAKVPDAHPDPLHTYMSISGFALTAALLGQDSDRCVRDSDRWVKGLCPSLGISLTAAHGFATQAVPGREP